MSNGMLKICYVLPQYYKNSAENFFHISNFLAELGKKVELYVVVEHSDVKPKIDNVVKTFLLEDKLKYDSSIVRLVKLINIYIELSKNGVNIFFARASLTGVLPLVIANRILNFNQANVVFWSCGQDVVPLSFIPTRKNIKRVVSKLLALFAFRGVNYLATGPELMIDYYNQYYKIPRHKTLLLYNDISLDRFYPLSSQEKYYKKNELLSNNKKVLLFVHTFNKCRGTDILPLIAKELKNKQLNAMIIAIGRSGDYSNELTEKINEEYLQDYLLNLGEVANRNIVKFYQIADLFLMPSRGEGFPRVLLESMACGCPPLSFNVGGVADILPANAANELLVSLEDENKFVNQSIRLVSNSELLQELSDKSYDKVKQYQTSRVVSMYINQLSKL